MVAGSILEDVLRRVDEARPPQRLNLQVPVTAELRERLDAFCRKHKTTKTRLLRAMILELLAEDQGE